jgi:hypothetical protein
VQIGKYVAFIARGHVWNPCLISYIVVPFRERSRLHLFGLIDAKCLRAKVCEGARRPSAAPIAKEHKLVLFMKYCSRNSLIVGLGTWIDPTLAKKVHEFSAQISSCGSLYMNSSLMSVKLQSGRRSVSHMCRSQVSLQSYHIPPLKESSLRSFVIISMENERQNYSRRFSRS